MVFLINSGKILGKYRDQVPTVAFQMVSTQSFIHRPVFDAVLQLLTSPQNKHPEKYRVEWKLLVYIPPVLISSDSAIQCIYVLTNVTWNLMPPCSGSNSLFYPENQYSKFLPNYTESGSKFTQSVSRRISIQEVSGSDLVRNSGYSELFLRPSKQVSELEDRLGHGNALSYPLRLILSCIDVDTLSK